jgi:hypothetical protein
MHVDFSLPLSSLFLYTRYSMLAVVDAWNMMLLRMFL